MKSFIPLTILLLSLSLYLVPRLWIEILLQIDLWTPWRLQTSVVFPYLHEFWLRSMPAYMPATPVPELPANFTSEDVYRLSNGYTSPVWARGVFTDSPAVEVFKDQEWWLKNFAEEKVLCLGHPDGSYCTIQEIFDDINSEKPSLYMSGSQELWDKYPQYIDWMHGEWFDRLSGGSIDFRIDQAFIGSSKSGTNLHAAAGTNIFRQVVGRKKWFFVSPSYKHFLFPSWNEHGLFGSSLTKVGKGGETISPWLERIPRWTVEVSPGDILINPAWVWHGIINKPGEGTGELVIGCPTRIGNPTVQKATIFNDPLMSIQAGIRMFIAGGGSISTGREIMIGGGGLGKTIGAGKEFGAIYDDDREGEWEFEWKNKDKTQ